MIDEITLLLKEKFRDELKEEIMEELSKNVLIDIKEAKDEISSIRFKIGQTYANFTNMVDKFNKDIKSNMNELFTNAEFIKTFKGSMFRYIEQELRVQLSQEGMADTIKEYINKQTSDHSSEFVIAVVEAVMKRLKKKIDSELSCVKDLTLSVDSEIKHLTRKHQTSYETEKMFKEKIFNMLDNFKMDDEILMIPER